MKINELSFVSLKYITTFAILKIKRIIYKNYANNFPIS